jgi:hypothetical protein
MLSRVPGGRVLLREGSSLTSRELVTRLGPAGWHLEVLDPDRFCLTATARSRLKMPVREMRQLGSRQERGTRAAKCAHRRFGQLPRSAAQTVPDRARLGRIGATGGQWESLTNTGKSTRFCTSAEPRVKRALSH